jgi:transcriptional regulator with XRE-family HTH domain/tetratricopeptide (TPR) repeat protein
VAVSQSGSFGALLRRWRTAAGLTQEELAERAGLSARGISDLERGIHLPQRATIRLLAESLGIDERIAASLERAPRGTFDPASSEFAGRGLAAAPPLVGRTAELTVLAEHLTGKGASLVTLGGEPGIGKSRLLYEAAQLGRAKGLTVLLGGCQRRSAQEPYAPIVQALAAQVTHMARRQLQSALQGCSWLSHLLPELEQLVRQPWPTEVTDSEQARRLMFGAVVGFLANLAGPVGTLLLLDDLQWAGTDALDLLAVLVRTAGEIRLRVVATYRTTEVDAAHPLFALIADLAKEQLLLPLAVDALATEDARRLLRGLLGEQEGNVSTEPIVQRAGGVPFFLVSWAHGLQADERLEAATGRVPWTLAQSIRQRVAALPLDARALLGMAAVIGREVLYPILIAACEQPEQEILIGLDAACRARLLTETGGGTYRFAHDVVREVIEAGLGDARRMLFHRRIGAALEQRPEREHEQRAAELAWHFRQGNEPERALPYALRAGDQARPLFAHDEAEQQYRLALRLAREVNDRKYEARALEKLGALYWTLGRHEEALPALEQAVDRFEDLADLDAVGRVVGKIGWTHSHRGTLTEGLARLEELVARLEGIDATRGHVDFYDALFHLYLEHGMHRELAPVAEHAAAAARAVGDDELLVRGELNRGLALYW